MVARRSAWAETLSLEVAADHASVSRPGALALVYEDGARVAFRAASKEARSDRARFMAMVLRGDSDRECWLFPKRRFFRLNSGVEVSTRQFAWQLAKGKPAGGRLITTCKTTDCCNPKHARLMPSDEERFWLKVKRGKPNECWTWLGMVRTKTATAGCKNLAGAFSVGRKLWGAHIYAWTILRGPVPKGGELFLTCFNKKCVNPAHLFLGTSADRNHFRNLSGAAKRAGDKLRGQGPAQRKAKVIEARIVADLAELKRVHLKRYNALRRSLRGRVR